MTVRKNVGLLGDWWRWVSGHLSGEIVAATSVRCKYTLGTMWYPDDFGSFSSFYNAEIVPNSLLSQRDHNPLRVRVVQGKFVYAQVRVLDRTEIALALIDKAHQSRLLSYVGDITNPLSLGEPFVGTLSLSSRTEARLYRLHCSVRSA